MMVHVVKKKIGKKTYYYLKHTLRSKGTFKTKEKYLGKALPDNIESVMLDFFREINEEKYNEIEILKDKVKNLPRSIKEKNLKDFGIRFTYNTNKIEGSTLSLNDTFKVIDDGISPGNKPLSDIKEAENHFRVFIEALKQKKITLNKVLNWHHEIFKETKKDIAGKIRNHGVRISRSKFIPPSPVELNALLRAFFSWLDKNENKYSAVDLAGLAHYRFVTIHPFGDGNGRISRLIMNWILYSRGYPMFIIEYKNRNRYYSALENAQVKENSFIFLTWFLKNYVRFLKTEIRD
ncbi:MAG: Fic family protein [Promethearchaeota archaeon]